MAGLPLVDPDGRLVRQPTKPGWYAYSGGDHTMIFLLTTDWADPNPRARAWWAIYANGSMSRCSWAFIRANLGEHTLVPMAPEPLLHNCTCGSMVVDRRLDP